MKKIYTLLALLLCTVYTQAQKVLPQLKLVKGASYSQVSNVTSTIGQVINGQALDIDMIMGGKMTFTVTAIRDSLYDMQARYDSLSLSMNLPTGKAQFSSESGAKDIMTMILAKMKNNPISVVMAKTGRIVSVSGSDAMIKDIVSTFTDVPEAQRNQALAQMQNSFGEKALKGNIDMSLYIYPTKKVDKNGTWAIDNKLESTITLNSHTVYTLKDVTSASYVITGTSLLNSVSEAESQINGMPVKYNLTGNINKEITADKATGWITSAKLTQAVKGNVEIKDNPKLPGGMIIPMTITSSTTITNK